MYDFSKLDALFKERIGKDGDAPGAVALVRASGQLVFYGVYGYRQLFPEELPMTEDTLFDVASLTKSVATALAILQLYSRGILDLDERLSTYLPDVEDPYKRDITIRDLLAHTSGLPAWRPYYKEVAARPNQVAPSEIYRRILEEPLETPVGTCETYSDLGYILLGWILERVTGEAMDAVCGRLVFEPLGLRATRFRKSVHLGNGEGENQSRPIASTEWCPWRGRMLTGEVHDENCFVMGGVAGHAGLFSTAEELDRIAVELMKGYHGDTSLFHHDSVKVFLKRQTIVKGGTWGLGWDTPSPTYSAAGRYFSKNSFGHTGFTGTSLWMDMDKEVTVVLLTNRVHPTRAREGIRELRPAVHNTVMECLGLI